MIDQPSQPTEDMMLAAHTLDLAPNNRRYGTAMSNLLEFQRLCMRRARQTTLKASVLAALCRAWCDLEERRRILRGIPLPVAGSLPMKKLRASIERQGKINFAPPREAPVEVEPPKESLNPDGP